MQNVRASYEKLQRLSLTCKYSKIINIEQPFGVNRPEKEKEI